MAEGMIFDLQEFAVHDGPGIRVVVFLKGCPLRCEWCHNPEGQLFQSQLVVSVDACHNCGRCAAVCRFGAAPFNWEKCTACGQCVSACLSGLRRICGSRVSSQELVERLMGYKDFLERCGGGVTFSGGEPLAQSDFLIEVLDQLELLHTAVETSGYAPTPVFRDVLSRVDLVLFDLKHSDPKIHKQFTGVDNALILENLRVLKDSGKCFIARIPLIPGVNDDIENMRAIADLLADSPGLQRVEFLRYHTTAGAKYKMIGREYCPSFATERSPQVWAEPFEACGIRSVVL